MELETFADNRHSHYTAKKRERISFPARWLWENGYLRGRILDLGCGYDKDGETLRSLGLAVDSFDPYYKPETITDQYNTVMCLYVLNVLLPVEQAQVMMEVSRRVAPLGRAYFAVRRDLTHDGYRRNPIYKVETYQCTVVLPWKSIFKNDFVEIYEYVRWDELHPKYGDIIKENAHFECETASVVAYKLYSNSNSRQFFVKSKIEPDNFFKLSLKRQMACWVVVNNICDEIDSVFIEQDTIRIICS